MMLDRFNIYVWYCSSKGYFVTAHAFVVFLDFLWSM